MAGLINRERDLACEFHDDDGGFDVKLRQTRPDLMIVGGVLDDGEMTDVLKRMLAIDATMKILVISVCENGRQAVTALRAGVRGYVSNREPWETLHAAIRRVIGGAFHLSDRINTVVLGKSLALPGAMPGNSSCELLSARELQIYELTGDGLSRTEIAARIKLSVKTVESYRQRIRVKLGFKNARELRQAAVAWMRKLGS